MFRQYWYLTSWLLSLGFIICAPFTGMLAGLPIAWDGITLYDWQRIEQLVIFSLVVSIGAGAVENGCWCLTKKLTISSLLILLFGLFSILSNSLDWWNGIHEVCVISLLSMSVWTLRAAKGKIPELIEYWVLPLFTGVAGLYTALFFINNFDELFIPEFIGDPLRFIGFNNIRFFSDWQMLLLPFTVAFASTKDINGRIIKTCTWCLVIAFAMLFFFTGSRVVVWGQLGTHALLFGVLGKRYLPMLRKHGLCWMGAGALFIVVTQLPPLLNGVKPASLAHLIRGGLSAREIIWEQALVAVISHPLLGIGPGALAQNWNPIAAAPHNSILMIVAEWGVIAALLTVCTGLGWIGRALCQLSYEDRPSISTLAIWQALITLLLHSLVANVLVVPLSQSALVLAVSMLPVGDSTTHQSSSDSGRHLKALLLMGPALLAIWIVTVDLPSLPARNQEQLLCRQPTQFFSPRFWQQGWWLMGCPGTHYRSE